MELIRYGRVLRRWAWLIVLCPLVAVVVAGLITLQLPKIYEAQVAVLVRPAQPLGVDPGVSALTADQVMRTYARLMTDRSLLDKVISDMHLGTDAVGLRRQIKVTPEPNTTILDVAVQDTNPNAARDVANTLVSDFIARIKQIQQDQASTSNARTADSLYQYALAATPDQPVAPRPLLNVGLALLAGILGGLGLAFLLDYLDQRVRSDETLIERVGLTPIAHVAYVAAKQQKQGELVAVSQDSPVAEAYKAFRTNLLFSSLGTELKTLVITSASPNEGKSRTAANLAIVLAQAGHPTLLVDADFRRPSLHRMFGRVRNLGLSNLILQDRPEAELFLVDDQFPNLTLVASGPTPPNPSELLGSGQMKALLSRFRKAFDYVILDTPPVNAVTDATVLAATADGSVLVVDTNSATYPSVLHAKQALERVGSRVLGAVMNKLRSTGGNYYYYQSVYGYGEPNGRAGEPEARKARSAVRPPKPAEP